MIKTKKAGLVTKLVVAILLVYVAISLWHLNTRIATAREEVNALDQQVQAQQKKNAELADAINNSDDPEHRKNIAREKLGLLEPGEKMFHITD